MTACGAVGALLVGGRVVGQVKCDREAGHDVGPFPKLIQRMEWPSAANGWRSVPGRFMLEQTPHRMILEWQPEAEVDLDLFDPDEHFDVEIPIE